MRSQTSATTKPEKPSRRQVNVSLPDAMYQELDRRALAEHAPVSTYARDLIEDALKPKPPPRPPMPPGPAPRPAPPPAALASEIEILGRLDAIDTRLTAMDDWLQKMAPPERRRKRPTAEDERATGKPPGTIQSWRGG
jgi:hypothetical protein